MSPIVGTSVLEFSSPPRRVFSVRLCGNFIVVGVLCRPRKKIVNSSWIWQSSYQGQLEIPYYLASVDSLNSLYSEHSSSAERSLLLRFGSSVLQAGSGGPTAVTYRRCSHKRSLGPKRLSQILWVARIVLRPVALGSLTSMFSSRTWLIVGLATLLARRLTVAFVSLCPGL